MNKQKFLIKYKKALRGCSAAEIQDRLAFDSEMIDDRVEEGLSEKEGARVLHLTVPAFRSRLHRARKQLSALLEKEVELG